MADTVFGSTGTPNTTIGAGLGTLASPGGGIGTTGSVTEAAWQFIQDAGAGSLRDLFTTQQNASQDPVNQIQFLQTHLGPMMGQLAVNAINQ